MGRGGEGDGAAEQDTTRPAAEHRPADRAGAAAAEHGAALHRAPQRRDEPGLEREMDTFFRRLPTVNRTSSIGQACNNSLRVTGRGPTIDGVERVAARDEHL